MKALGTVLLGGVVFAAAFSAVVVWNDRARHTSSPLDSVSALVPMLGAAGAESVPAGAGIKAAPAQQATATITGQTTNQAGLGGAWGRFQTGDYEGAIVLLRKDVLARPTDTAARENLATALFALALVKVKAQQLADAEKCLEESARLGNAEAARALASLKLKLGNVDLASSLFEDLFDATKDPQSLRVLVDMALRGDELDRAGYFLSELPESDAFTISRRKRLELKRAFSHTQESVERGGVVEVAAAAGLPASLAPVVAQAMEETLTELSTLMGPVPSTTRVKAFLYPKENFQDYTNAPPWAGGLFDGLISIPVPKLSARSSKTGETTAHLAQALAKVARHETTHAYLYAFCGDTIPSWLGEGLAQRQEGRQRDGALNLLKQKGKDASEASPLLDESFAKAPPLDVSRLYAQSFLLVNHLSRQGNDALGYWRGMLARACQGRESLANVLSGELGESTARELWTRSQSSILTRN